MGSKSRLFGKYFSVTRFFRCSQLWEFSQQPQLWYHYVSRSTLRKVFFQQKQFWDHLTYWSWYPFKLFLLFNRVLLAQKIIIFVVVYWKACNILRKWYTTIVNICLFSHFNLTFYISQQQWILHKLKLSNLVVQEGKNYITLGDCLISVWKSSNSYVVVHVM